jgi:hypothetical protein
MINKGITIGNVIGKNIKTPNTQTSADTEINNIRKNGIIKNNNNAILNITMEAITIPHVPAVIAMAIPNIGKIQNPAAEINPVMIIKAIQTNKTRENILLLFGILFMFILKLVISFDHYNSS